MFPFIIDHRAHIEPSLAIYQATRSTLRSKHPKPSRSSSSSSTSTATSTPPPLYTSSSRNSLHNPYAYVPKASSSLSTKSTTTSSSSSSTRSRLTEINKTYDSTYGAHDPAHATAEEIRHSQQSSAAQMKDLEALPAYTTSPSTLSSSSTTSSSSASSSSESPRKLKRRFTDRIFRRRWTRVGSIDGEDDDLLMDFEGR